VEIVRRAIRTDGIVSALGIEGSEAFPLSSEIAPTLRTSLANAGLPDGFDLSMAALYAPGAEIIAGQLAEIGIQTRVSRIDVPQSGDLTSYHLILFGNGAQGITTGVAGAEIIDLFTIPISYRAVPELTIEFNSDGFPLARR
jgi:hypothetical protein